MRIWDDALEGADALAVARVLAAAVEREAPDLVLCGVQSSDAVNGATGIALAGFLDLPHVAVVKRLELRRGERPRPSSASSRAASSRSCAFAPPALLTIQTGINQPRYATLRAIKQAREKPLAGRGLADAGPRRGGCAARRRIAPARARDARPQRRRGDDRRLGRRGRGAHRRDRQGAGGLMAGSW